MFQLHSVHVNLLAVCVAWLVHVILGLIWFSPAMFGNAWSKLTGQELKPAPKWIVPAMVGHLLMVLVLLSLIKLTGAATGLVGVWIGLLAWIGFIVPLETGELVWEKIPFRLFLIRCGNHLIGLAVTGYILGAWH